MKLIVGLGNPENKYLKTFHNLGFLAVEETARLLGLEFCKEKCRAMIAEGIINGEKVVLAKPLTYMNLSGESVRDLVSFYKIPLENVLVMYDDYDLPKGKIRMREKGSAGTHNGMRNIVLHLGSENFARLRVGFRPSEPIIVPLIDLVLSGIKEEDKEIFARAISLSAKAGQDFANGVPVQKIMLSVNGN